VRYLGGLRCCGRGVCARVENGCSLGLCVRMDGTDSGLRVRGWELANHSISIILDSIFNSRSVTVT
jgi:hypothetical protein